MTRSLIPCRVLLATVLALGTAGCKLSDIVDAALWGDPNPAADISGEWTIAADATCYEYEDCHTAAGQGSVFFTTSGGLSGSAALDGEPYMTYSGPLVNVSKDGADMSFRTPGCVFRCTVRSEPAYLQGRWDCGGVGGSWTGNRPEPAR